MKKLVVTMFLVFGVLGFSRFIEECRITSKGRGYFQGNGYRRLYLEGYEYLYN